MSTEISRPIAEQAIWRCSTESAEDTRFFHCEGDMNGENFGTRYDPKVKKPLFEPCPNPEYNRSILGSCNTVRTDYGPDRAAEKYCQEYLHDGFGNGTEMEIWVRDADDNVWHGYIEMTDCEAEDEEGNSLEPSELEWSDLAMAGSTEWHPSVNLEPWDESDIEACPDLLQCLEMLAGDNGMHLKKDVWRDIPGVDYTTLQEQAKILSQSEKEEFVMGAQHVSDALAQHHRIPELNTFLNRAFDGDLQEQIFI